MRIKIDDKIYRLKEIESGVDSLMELVEEPKYKDGDFLHSDWNDENITIIYREINGSHLYYHVNKSNGLGLDFDRYRYWPDDVDFRLATESEKKELIDALAEVGKRWNADKKCIEDIPKRKFKKGDKVKIKYGVSSKTHHSVVPYFIVEMDDLIGKTMTVYRYTEGDEYVACEETEYIFHEDWLESYVEDIPKRKFRAGDKVKIKDGISSKTHRGVGPGFVNTMDKFIGKELTVKEYSSRGWVVFYGDEYEFAEDWLEPYEELKKGDLAIFWDDDKNAAVIGKYGKFTAGRPFPHSNHREHIWKNALKFESKEQYEKLLKGEI
jgi:hypothetical protein